MNDPLVNFVTDELKFATQHLVTSKVKEITDISSDLDADFDEIENIRERFQEMAVIWSELKPIEKIVRSLFPQYSNLFDVLDKFSALDQDCMSVIK